MMNYLSRGQTARDGVLRSPCWHGVMKGRVKHSDHRHTGAQHGLCSLDGRLGRLIVQGCQLTELGEGRDDVVIQARGCHKVGSTVDNTMTDGI